MLSHRDVKQLVHKAVPSMGYEERKLFEQKDYEGLLQLVDRYLRSAKGLLILGSLLILSNPFIQGLLQMRRSMPNGIADGTVYDLFIFMAVAVVATAGLVAFQLPRLAAMERARFALQLIIKIGGPAGTQAASGVPEGRNALK